MVAVQEVTEQAAERLTQPRRARRARAHRLLTVSTPVMDRLAGELEGTGVAIIVSDERERVIYRRGADQRALADVTTASAPVVDRGTGQRLGSVALVWPHADAPLLRLVVRQCAREIEERLLDGRSVRERVPEGDVPARPAPGTRPAHARQRRHDAVQRASRTAFR